MALTDFADPARADSWDQLQQRATWHSNRPNEVYGVAARYGLHTLDDVWWWKLRDEQRAVVRLRDRGMTWGEIAARLQRDRAGCYRSWKRAMAKRPESGNLAAPVSEKAYPKGRACAVPGCVTVLATANPGPCCCQHIHHR